jgi:hypothetical protein
VFRPGVGVAAGVSPSTSIRSSRGSSVEIAATTCAWDATVGTCGSWVATNIRPTKLPPANV